ESREDGGGAPCRSGDLSGSGSSQQREARSLRIFFFFFFSFFVIVLVCHPPLVAAAWPLVRKALYFAGRLCAFPELSLFFPSVLISEEWLVGMKISS
ncbi:hypothetical protein B296_00013849, partial [Ensete ventricosum]